MNRAFTSPIMIAAGGTGGHMFPGVSLASSLTSLGHPVIFVSDNRGASLSRDTLGLPPEIERYAISAGRFGGGIFPSVRGARALIKGLNELSLIHI